MNSIGKLIMDSVNHKKEIKKIIAYFLNIIKEMAKHTHMTEEEQEDLLTDMDGGYLGLYHAEEILEIINKNS